MKTLDASSIETPDSFVTTATRDDALANDTSSPDAERRRAWNSVIDNCLIEWGRNPDLPADNDPDFIPPSPEIVCLAAETVNKMRSQKSPAPTRVVPNGDGGITFSRHDGPFYQVVEIDADGTVELRIFENSQLIGRRRWW